MLGDLAVVASGSPDVEEEIVKYKFSGFALALEDLYSLTPLRAKMLVEGVADVDVCPWEKVQELAERFSLKSDPESLPESIVVRYICVEDPYEEAIWFSREGEGVVVVNVGVRCEPLSTPVMVSVEGLVTVYRSAEGLRVVVEGVMEAAIDENGIEFILYRGGRFAGFDAPGPWSVINDGIERFILEYTIVGTTAVTSNGDVMGFSPFYIVYPLNEDDLQSLYESGEEILYFRWPLTFSSWKFFYSAPYGREEGYYNRLEELNGVVTIEAFFKMDQSIDHVRRFIDGLARTQVYMDISGPYVGSPFATLCVVGILYYMGEYSEPPTVKKAPAKTTRSAPVWFLFDTSQPGYNTMDPKRNLVMLEYRSHYPLHLYSLPIVVESASTGEPLPLFLFDVTFEYDDQVIRELKEFELEWWEPPRSFSPEVVILAILSTTLVIFLGYRLYRGYRSTP